MCSWCNVYVALFTALVQSRMQGTVVHIINHIVKAVRTEHHAWFLKCWYLQQITDSQVNICVTQGFGKHTKSVHLFLLK